MMHKIIQMCNFSKEKIVFKNLQNSQEFLVAEDTDWLLSCLSVGLPNVATTLRSTVSEPIIIMLCIAVPCYRHLV